MGLENIKQRIAKNFDGKLESEIADLELEEHKRLGRLREKEVKKQKREAQIIENLKVRY